MRRGIIHDICKGMVIKTKKLIRCSAYEHIIFCWVMHEQKIIEDILSGLDTRACQVVSVSLVCSPKALEKRLRKDVERGSRGEDVIARSLERISLYEGLDTVKIDVSGLSPEEAAEKVAGLPWTRPQFPSSLPRRHHDCPQHNYGSSRNHSPGQGLVHKYDAEQNPPESIRHIQRHAHSAAHGGVCPIPGQKGHGGGQP